MSGCIRNLSISHSPVFLLNSCLDLFSAPYLCRDPLSRSYGVNLPSSLTVNLSSASVCSTRPPVSVCGTGRHEICLAGFLGNLITSSVTSPEGSVYCQVSARWVDLPALRLPTPFNALFRQCAGVSLFRRHIALMPGNRIFTVCPSDAPRGCSLGPDLP